MSPGTLQAVN